MGKRSLQVVLSLVFGAAAFADVPYGGNDSAGAFASVNGIQLYYEVYGEGKPLLLIHGHSGSISSFATLIPLLAVYFKVIATDSRARGRSTDAAEPITYALIASDHAALLDQLAIPRATVVGWSDGGIVGLEMAIKHSEKVERLVSINPNYLPGRDVLATEELLAQPYDAEAGSSEMHRLREQFRAGFKRRAAPHTEEEKRIARKLATLIQDHPNLTLTQLATIAAPTLIMVGDHDVIPYEHTLEIFRAIPHAQLAVLPGSSHLFPLEKPDLTGQMILEFLNTPYYDVDPFYFRRP